MKRILDPLYPKHKVSYCKYGFDYQKHTAFWMDENLHQNFKPKCCRMDCEKIMVCPPSSRSKRGHIADMGKYGGGNNRLVRYRIPIDLIESLLNYCEFNN
jgi:hypothetical protein